MATKKKLLQAASGVSTGVAGAWDLAYAFPDDPNTYVTYGMSAPPPVSEDSGAFAEGSNPYTVQFKPDGTKMYVLIGAGATSADNDSVFQYSLSTPWNPSTKTYDNKKLSFNSEDAGAWGMFFKPDGTKVYMSGTSTDTLYQYSLSTAWDVSTGSYDSVSLSLSSFAGDTITLPTGIFFKPDGTRFYCVDTGNDDVHQFTLSTAWDLSTFTRETDFYIGDQETSPSGIALSPDGKYMTIFGYAGDDFTSYKLSTPWDTSTATLIQGSQVYIGGLETSGRGFVWGDEGRALFYTGTGTDQVRKIYVGGWNFDGEGTAPVDIAFNNDGTIMYILDDAGNDVNYYDLTTPYDTSEDNVVVDTAKRISQNESVPKALDFKADGTSFYVSSENNITQYDMSTAWDTSTASAGSTFNHTPTGAHGMRFRPDGTQVFVNYQADDTVKALNLSTAWDISTASYATGQSFDYSTQSANAWGIEFKPDGKKLYIHSESNDVIYQYSLSTAWDLTTASYDNTSYDARTKIGNISPSGIRFKPDGTKLFYLDGNEDRVIRIGVEDTS